MLKPFRDRAEGGRRLAEKLGKYAGRPDVLVLALPRGGVSVAFEVSQALGAPLDVLVVRKLGVPGHEELAMGAIASGGAWVLNNHLMKTLQPSIRMIQEVAAREHQELTRRERIYRGDRPALEVRGRTVILVDDGLATGSTMRAALAAVRRRKPAHLIVAAPAAAPSTCAELAKEVDECVCVITPNSFHAVGVWYEDFSQTTDDEVRDLLERASVPMMAATGERCHCGADDLQECRCHAAADFAGHPPAGTGGHGNGSDQRAGRVDEGHQTPQQLGAERLSGPSGLSDLVVPMSLE
jgi:predicted phosphoribosyltransferase